MGGCVFFGAIGYGGGPYVYSIPSGKTPSLLRYVGHKQELNTYII